MFTVTLFNKEAMTAEQIEEAADLLEQRTDDDTIGILFIEEDDTYGPRIEVSAVEPETIASFLDKHLEDTGRAWSRSST